MIGVEWFRYRGLWHAVELGSQVRAECGLTMKSPQQLTAGTEDQPMPPAPCMKCAVRVQDRFMVEEPLDEAIGRGYVRVDLSDPE